MKIEPLKVVLRTFCFECYCFRDHLVKRGHVQIAFVCEVCGKKNVTVDRIARQKSRAAILKHARTIYIEQKLMDKEGLIHYGVCVEAVTGSGIGGLCIATMNDASAKLCIMTTLLDGQVLWKEY